MSASNTHVQPGIAVRSGLCGNRLSFSAIVGCVLVTIGALFCCASLSAQAPDSPAAEGSTKSWTATTELRSDNLLPTRIPVRITENQQQQGNRTLEERSVQIEGGDGRLAPYQEIETETLRVDATTVRTTIRTLGRDVNGAKSLIQIRTEERQSLPDGGSTVLAITFNPDINGKLQPVQRETTETRAISKDAEEVNTTVMLPNINGGLDPVLKTNEVRKSRKDGTTESHKSTLIADGAGEWELNETRQVTSSQDGSNRKTEELIFRRNQEGKLAEVSRVASEESNGAEEENGSVETFSADVPGTTRDGKLHLVERASSLSRTDPSGGRTTQRIVEQPNPGDPDAGLRISVLMNDKMVPSTSGTRSTTTIRARDSNDRFDIVSVDTTNSDPIPTIQIHRTPPEEPK